jgi:hypothetical protein
VYLLDGGAGKIWRYPVTTEGFGNKQDWVATSENVDFAGASSMAIDGSVWFIRGGEMFKFTRGVRDGFTVNGLDNEWGSGAVIYTTDETENIYILDAANSRVIVVKKNGEYLFQLKAEGLTKIKDIAVDETKGKMYLVGDSKLWEVGL